jgi:hypothetical protein
VNPRQVQPFLDNFGVKVLRDVHGGDDSVYCPVAMRAEELRELLNGLENLIDPFARQVAFDFDNVKLVARAVVIGHDINLDCPPVHT